MSAEMPLETDFPTSTSEKQEQQSDQQPLQVHPLGGVVRYQKSSGVYTSPGIRTTYSLQRANANADNVSSPQAPTGRPASSYLPPYSASTNRASEWRYQGASLGRSGSLRRAYDEENNAESQPLYPKETASPANLNVTRQKSDDSSTSDYHSDQNQQQRLTLKGQPLELALQKEQQKKVSTISHNRRYKKEPVFGGSGRKKSPYCDSNAGRRRPLAIHSVFREGRRPVFSRAVFQWGEKICRSLLPGFYNDIFPLNVTNFPSLCLQAPQA